MNPHTLYVIGLLMFPALAIINAVWFGTELKRFVDSTPALRSTRDMERFKTAVGHQMYAALAQIVLLAAPMLVFLAGIVTGALDPSDIMFVIAPAVVILLVAAVYRRWEQRAKALVATDPELESQREAIVRTWMRRPFPDW
jgi:hypothetical protein